MKDSLTLLTFGIGALCFVVFFATLKPAVVIAAVGSEKPSYCGTKAAPALACRPHLIAAALWPEVGHR